MNKIKVVDGNVEKSSIDNNIELDYFKNDTIFSIGEITITVNKSTNLELEITIKEETRLNININVKDNSELNINIITKGNSGKIKYNYNLYENSIVDVYKFQNIDSIKELVNVYLKGENAKINYNFKTIGNNKETYDYNIYHDSKNTESNIKNNGVCIDNGLIIYQVSSYVPKDIVGCIVNQNNRIINLTNNKCEIRPNLYIDTADVSASHSALIGRFTKDEMFYMQSRGIDAENALKLLIKGFLTSDITDNKVLNEINKNIDKYWR